MATFLFYAGSGLDRAARLRRDAAWLEANSRDRNSRLLLFWRSLHVIIPESPPRPLSLSAADDRGLLERAGDLVFLGQRDGTCHFAVDVSGLDEDEVRRQTAGD